MPKRLLDVDPSGLRTYHTLEDGKNYISYEQDNLQPLMDLAHEVREHGDIKRTADIVPHASLPMSVVLQLKFKHGIDVLAKLEPADEQRLNYLLETEYKAFKLTNMKMWLPT
jgi:hypothetical protein